MDDAADADLLASGEQRAHSRRMNAFRILTPAVLQYAGAVDDHIDIAEMRKPVFWMARGCHIQNQPARDLWGARAMAREPHDLVSVSHEARRYFRSNESSRPDYQDFHQLFLD